MSDVERETLEVDVLFVGAGPANLAAAIRLQQLVADHNQRAEKANRPPIEPLTVAMIEKGSEVGSHQMSGAVLDPTPLKELIPDFQDRGCPLESPVTSDSLYFFTPTKSFRFPVTPPAMRNHGNYVVSLSKFTRWLGAAAEEAGVDVFAGFAGTEVLYEGRRVVGVATGDKGLNGEGKPKENFEAGIDIRAKCTVFGEGVRGYLAKQLIPKLGLDAGKHPQVFETGVKEVWECQPGRFSPGMVVHAMGYPLSRDTAGGSFIYGMKDNLLTIGLVASLDYHDPFLEPYAELQKLKSHPCVAKWIGGGKPVAYGAKALAAAGYYAVPKLTFDGGLLVGESAQLLDISRLKGIHVGMRSGMLAAEAIFSNLVKGDSFTAEKLSPYPSRFSKSREGRDLYRSRNFHAAVSRGFPQTFFHLLSQQLTGGRGLVDPMPLKLDRDEYQTVEERHGDPKAKIPTPAPGKHDLDKLTAVDNSGTAHDEDQPCHLKIRNFQVCYDLCGERYRYPCNRFCPAKVYEILEEEGNRKLQVNFTNCVHCQTCDIKCPEDNILWTPPEGGGGPKYTLL